MSLLLHYLSAWHITGISGIQLHFTFCKLLNTINQSRHHSNHPQDNLFKLICLTALDVVPQPFELSTTTVGMMISSLGRKTHCKRLSDKNYMARVTLQLQNGKYHKIKSLLSEIFSANSNSSYYQSSLASASLFIIGLTLLQALCLHLSLCAG